jgi:hypothetical protein
MATKLPWKPVTSNARDALFCATFASWQGGLVIFNTSDFATYMVKTAKPRRVIGTSTTLLDAFAKNKSEPVSICPVPADDVLYLVGHRGAVAHVPNASTEWVIDHPSVSVSVSEMAMGSLQTAVHDKARNRLLCWGMRVARTWRPDLWSFDLAARSWQKLDAGSEQPAEWDASGARSTDSAFPIALGVDYQLVYDAGRNRVLRFGGREASQLGANDAWEPLPGELPKIQPYARHIAYDTATESTFIWDLEKRAVWRWRDGQCEPLARFNKPPMRDIPHARYDAIHRRLLGVDYNGKIFALAM